MKQIRVVDADSGLRNDTVVGVTLGNAAVSSPELIISALPLCRAMGASPPNPPSLASLEVLRMEMPFASVPRYGTTIVRHDGVEWFDLYQGRGTNGGLHAVFSPRCRALGSKGLEQINTGGRMD